MRVALVVSLMDALLNSLSPKLICNSTLTEGGQVRVKLLHRGRRLIHAEYFQVFPKDYSELQIAYRPSYADVTYDMKYGVRAVQGGGRSSARETIGRVATGAVAKKILKSLTGTKMHLWF